MTDNNISFLGKNNKNNDKKNVSDKNINSDTIENISNKNTVLDAADKKNISGKTTTLSAAAKSKQTQTDQNYHQQVSLRDTKKLREQLKELPTFCKDFFRGIEPKTTTKTRMGYASDLRTFFRFLLSANPELSARQIDAKKNIFTHHDRNGCTVLNMDNTLTKSFKSAGELRYFSRREPVSNGFYCLNGKIYSSFNGNTVDFMSASDILLPGVHNIENYLAAFSAVHDFVGFDVMKKVAGEFSGVEHRIELVRELDGVKYYNDSIASSPSRTIAGLRSFDRKVILIAGGKDKGVPFDDLGDEICKRVKYLILTGFTAGRIREATEKSENFDGTLPITVTDKFDEAVFEARKAARPGDIVILSPASTSFDRFKNFAERGNTFKDIVNGLE